jgi:hypothetical protein
VGHTPELFDLQEDPGEFENLAGWPELADVQAGLHRALLDIVDDPAAVDAAAKKSQSLDPTRRVTQPRFGW